MLVKEQDISVDHFDGDLLLMNMKTRQMVVLNASGAILWEALDQLPTQADLVETAAMAFPELERSAVVQAIDTVIGTLVAAGVLIEQPAIAASIDA